MDLDWEKLVRRYVWHDERTPYFTRVANLTRRQAHYELFAYTLFMGVLAGVLAVVSPSSGVSLYAFSVCCAALLLGVSLSGLAWLIVFRGLWAAFIHSNVRLPIGPLRALIGAPELHHWHHAREREVPHHELQRGGYGERRGHLDVRNKPRDVHGGRHGEDHRSYRTYVARMEELGVHPEPFSRTVAPRPA